MTATAGRYREALEAIVALDFTRDDHGRPDFYSGAGRFVSAWLIAAGALDVLPPGGINDPVKGEA